MNAPPRKRRTLVREPGPDVAEATGILIDEVLSDAELAPFTPRTVLVAETAPNRANDLLKTLNKILPLPSFAKHLKRVRRRPIDTAGTTEPSGGDGMLQVLVCDPAEEEKLLQPTIVEALEPFSLSLRPAEVSAYPPLTDAQYVEWNAIWPISARPPPKEVLPPSKWPPEELEDCVRYMNIAVCQANEAKRKGERPIGAVVVNPNTGQVVTAGHDCSSGHPLEHAVMVCIHQVAAKDLSENPSARGNYLCTGYHLYITREPCVMCAMAVLHSRFARAFFGAPNPQMGGLGGHTKLHTNPLLNHHFCAYWGPLRDECGRLYSTEPIE